MKFIYSPVYSQIDIGSHVFPLRKYDLVREHLLRHGHARKEDFIQASPVREEDLLLVHEETYLGKLREGRLTPEEVLVLELPYSDALFQGARIGVQGSMMASERAMREGISVHLGGGFHHAFPDHGEGFCLLNDVAVSARWLLREKKAGKVMILDCDLHQGNGTAWIFRKEPDVFTFSIHQENNYPGIKPPSDLDIGLPDGTGDREYLQHLEKHLPGIVEKFSPDIIIYLAGADPYKGDQLGGLKLTKAG